MSSLHKVLVEFELDPDRRFKIHKRRVAFLEEPLNALSQNVYLLICR